MEIDNAIQVSNARSRSAQPAAFDNDPFRLLFEYNLDAIVIADNEGRYIDVNSRACALFQRTRKQMLCMRVGDLMTPDGPTAKDQYERYLRTGSEEGQFIFLSPDNEIRVASYTAFRVADNRHISILRDISAQKRGEMAQQTLDAMRLEVERDRLRFEIDNHQRRLDERHQADAQINLLNARLRRAVYESSHRIKNQLQILAATVDIALMDGEAQISAEAMKRVGAQVRTMSVLQDILTLEWKSNATGDVETISSKMMLERVLNLLRQTAGGERVSFRIEDSPLLMRTATTLALICNEAVANGIKHGKHEVEISFAVNAGTGIFEVRDDGPGFPSGFDPKRDANTGLELISSLATHDLQGTASYENCELGGARVTVSFPLIPKPIL